MKSAPQFNKNFLKRAQGLLKNVKRDFLADKDVPRSTSNGWSAAVGTLLGKATPPEIGMGVQACSDIVPDVSAVVPGDPVTVASIAAPSGGNPGTVVAAEASDDDSLTAVLTVSPSGDEAVAAVASTFPSVSVNKDPVIVDEVQPTQGHSDMLPQENSPVIMTVPETVSGDQLIQSDDNASASDMLGKQIIDLKTCSVIEDQGSSRAAPFPSAEQDSVVQNLDNVSVKTGAEQKTCGMAKDRVSQGILQEDVCMVVRDKTGAVSVEKNITEGSPRKKTEGEESRHINVKQTVENDKCQDETAEQGLRTNDIQVTLNGSGGPPKVEPKKTEHEEGQMEFSFEKNVHSAAAEGSLKRSCKQICLIHEKSKGEADALVEHNLRREHIHGAKASTTPGTQKVRRKGRTPMKLHIVPKRDGIPRAQDSPVASSSFKSTPAGQGRPVRKRSPVKWRQMDLMMDTPVKCSPRSLEKKQIMVKTPSPDQNVRARACDGTVKSAERNLYIEELHCDSVVIPTIANDSVDSKEGGQPLEPAIPAIVLAAVPTVEAHGPSMEPSPTPMVEPIVSLVEPPIPSIEPAIYTVEPSASARKLTDVAVKAASSTAKSKGSGREPSAPSQNPTALPTDSFVATEPPATIFHAVETGPVGGETPLLEPSRPTAAELPLQQHTGKPRGSFEETGMGVCKKSQAVGPVRPMQLKCGYDDDGPLDLSKTGCKQSYDEDFVLSYDGPEMPLDLTVKKGKVEELMGVIRSQSVTQIYRNGSTYNMYSGDIGQNVIINNKGQPVSPVRPHIRVPLSAPGSRESTPRNSPSVEHVPVKRRKGVAATISPPQQLPNLNRPVPTKSKGGAGSGVVRHCTETGFQSFTSGMGALSVPGLNGFHLREHQMAPMAQIKPITSTAAGVDTAGCSLQQSDQNRGQYSQFNINSRRGRYLVAPVIDMTEDGSTRKQRVHGTGEMKSPTVSSSFICPPTSTTGPKRELSPQMPALRPLKQSGFLPAGILVPNPCTKGAAESVSLVHKPALVLGASVEPTSASDQRAIQKTFNVRPGVVPTSHLRQVSEANKQSETGQEKQRNAQGSFQYTTMADIEDRDNPKIPLQTPPAQVKCSKTDSTPVLKTLLNNNSQGIPYGQLQFNAVACTAESYSSALSQPAEQQKMEVYMQPGSICIPSSPLAPCTDSDITPSGFVLSPTVKGKCRIQNGLPRDHPTKPLETRHTPGKTPKLVSAFSPTNRGIKTCGNPNYFYKKVTFSQRSQKRTHCISNTKYYKSHIVNAQSGIYCMRPPIKTEVDLLRERLAPVYPSRRLDVSTTLMVTAINRQRFADWKEETRFYKEFLCRMPGKLIFEPKISKTFKTPKESWSEMLQGELQLKEELWLSLLDNNPHNAKLKVSKHHKRRIQTVEEPAAPAVKSPGPSTDLQKLSADVVQAAVHAMNVQNQPKPHVGTVLKVPSYPAKTVLNDTSCSKPAEDPRQKPCLVAAAPTIHSQSQEAMRTARETIKRESVEEEFGTKLESSSRIKQSHVREEKKVRRKKLSPKKVGKVHLDHVKATENSGSQGKTLDHVDAVIDAVARNDISASSAKEQILKQCEDEKEGNEVTHTINSDPIKTNYKFCLLSSGCDSEQQAASKTSKGGSVKMTFTAVPGIGKELKKKRKCLTDLRSPVTVEHPKVRNLKSEPELVIKKEIVSSPGKTSLKKCSPLNHKLTPISILTKHSPSPVKCSPPQHSISPLMSSSPKHSPSPSSSLSKHSLSPVRGSSLDLKSLPVMQSPLKYSPPMKKSPTETGGVVYDSSESDLGQSVENFTHKRKHCKLLEELINTDGYIAEKKVRQSTDDLFADPSQLTREERALQVCGWKEGRVDWHNIISISQVWYNV